MGWRLPERLVPVTERPLQSCWRRWRIPKRQKLLPGQPGGPPGPRGAAMSSNPPGRAQGGEQQPGRSGMGPRVCPGWAVPWGCSHPALEPGAGPRGSWDPGNELRKMGRAAAGSLKAQGLQEGGGRLSAWQPLAHNPRPARTCPWCDFPQSPRGARGPRSPTRPHRPRPVVGPCQGRLWWHCHSRGDPVWVLGARGEAGGSMAGAAARRGGGRHFCCGTPAKHRRGLRAALAVVTTGERDPHGSESCLLAPLPCWETPCAATTRPQP